MSDNESMLQVSGRTRLAGEVLILMLKGAGYALVFALVIWGFLAILAGIGGLLPPESQEALDPINRSQLEQVVPVIGAEPEATA